METSFTLLPHRRSRLPNRTIRSVLHHLCSSFERHPGVSLATPAVLQELVLRKEMAQTSEPGEVCADEKPPENLSIRESTANEASGESRAEKVETISQQNSLMLEDVFDGIDLQDVSVRGQHEDFFNDVELMINENKVIVPESCVNLFESLNVNDHDDDGMVASLDDTAKQPLDLVQNIVEKPNIVTGVQVDPVDVDKKVSENNGFKAEEVPKSVESNEVISSGVLETDNETCQRKMELEKPVNSIPVLADSVSGIVEDDDVEEGEISGDDNDYMLLGDDEPVKRHEELHVSQEENCNSHLTSHKSSGSSHVRGVGSLSTPEIVYEKEQRQFSAGVSNVDNQAKKSDHTFNNEEKMDLGKSIKKRSAPSEKAKARKKEKYRKRRAKERIALGVKKLKLKPVAPKPKPIKYCRHYLKGRCHEGDKCKFSHDITPETKSYPCCYFATQSCMKGDDCPYDHDLSKYPCKNFNTKGFCHRRDSCLFSHKGTPQCTSETPNANVTTSPTNFPARSFSPQKKSKPTVREAIAKLPAIQTRVSGHVAFLKPSSQSDSPSPKINEQVAPPEIPPLRKPSVAPKGMSFLSLDKASQEDIVKSSLGFKQSTHNSDDPTLKQSQQISFLPMVPPTGISFLSFASEEHKALNQEPEEAASSRNLKTIHNSVHIQNSLNSAMKLAAEFESAKVERRNNDPKEVENKSSIAANTSVTRNSGNISSKVLEFLSSFSDGKN